MKLKIKSMFCLLKAAHIALVAGPVSRLSLLTRFLVTNKMLMRLSRSFSFQNDQNESTWVRGAVSRVHSFIRRCR